MKKIFSIIFAIFGASSVFADFSAFDFQGDLISKPKRYFEVGVDVDAAAGNNLVGITDVFQKDVVIDLTKISNDMAGSGFNFALFDKEKAFVNLNISSRFRFSIFAGVEASAHLNIADDLFELLGSGLSAGETKTIDVEAYADVHANVGFSLQTIINSYAVKLTPTYFVPLVYVPKTKATGKLITTSDGKIEAEASADLDIFTAINMDDAKLPDELRSNMADILSNGGFDLSLEIERNWLKSLNAGLYTRIPILPGKLNYKMSTRVYAGYTTENLIDSFIGDTEKPEITKPDFDDFSYSEDTYKVYRPLRLGVNATFTPLGQWLKIQPALGFALRNPYTAGDRKFYLEYALDFRVGLVKRIFNFNFGTAYQNQLFQQRFGFGLNLRVFEIMAQASFCGTSFLSSFSQDGYGAYIGFRFGF